MQHYDINSKSLNFITLILSFVLSISFLHSQEICNNGIDDDGDGLIDLNDIDDCSCYVSTLNNSIIPNPSFESFSCCPTGLSQTTCLNNWEKGSNATSDYFNLCGFTSQAMPIPLTDGNGATGIIIEEFYREYLATCLNSPLVAGQQYTLSLSMACRAQNGFSPYGECTAVNTSNYGPINFTLYGRTNCPTLPTTTNVNECPLVAGWTELGYATYTPNGSWSVINITFTPAQNIQSIILGPPCTVPSTYSPSGFCHPYFYMDNLILNQNTEPIEVNLSQNGSICENTLNLQGSTSSSGGTWQWFFEGVALIGQTSSTLSVNSNGNQIGLYTVQYNQGGICGTENFNLNTPCGLPVELTQFTYSCNSSKPNIYWTTISEYNNDYFELQFSIDGMNFETIASIDGAGNSNTVIKYTHSIRDYSKTEGYYKLKQVDFNGSIFYSNIIYVKCHDDNVNVAISDGNLIVKNAKLIKNCRIYDSMGKIIFNSSDIKSFKSIYSSAFYFIQIESDKGWSTHKFYGQN